MSVFLSTPSARRATQGLEQYNRHNQNFYPRPLRGGRPSATAKYTASKNFYPRPLRGGRRHGQCLSNPAGAISIHALCEEGDLRSGSPSGRTPLFLSTPSARRATVFAPRSTADLQISIHALCEEGDLCMWPYCSRAKKFLSTPSARRATRLNFCWLCMLLYFYPRPLRGGRPKKLLRMT